MAASVIAFGVSSLAATDWPIATGASLTAPTVIDTVATFESTVPSLALNVKLSGPDVVGRRRVGQIRGRAAERAVLRGVTTV